MGFDAIWISPVGLNLENTNGKGEAYHGLLPIGTYMVNILFTRFLGYWSTDPTRLNPHFGDESALLALSSALHARGMYLMVDVALNQLASTSSDISRAQLLADEGPLLFQNTVNFHPPCDIVWGNRTSEAVWSVFRFLSI
jgi:alpha-amylase